MIHLPPYIINIVIKNSLTLHCLIIHLHTIGRDDSRMASASCDPDSTDIITSGSGDPDDDTPVSSTVGGCGDEWRVACVVSGSIVVALLLVFVLAVVTTCVYR